jgi:glutamate synthase domain-containing protein 1
MKIKHRYKDPKDISNCGLCGFINKDRTRVNGETIVRGIALQHDRGNGLGGGFAAYGIYPDYKDFYALHVMCDNDTAMSSVEEFLEEVVVIEHREVIPTRKTPRIGPAPKLKRFFVKPSGVSEDYDKLGVCHECDDDYMVHVVMHINDKIDGAYVFSSGKNMGTFKGVGYPEDIAEFFRLEDYKGYVWTAHNRFPTNTPGWWGGAHPFTLLDWSIVHNGEITSYGINKRYLEMFGYRCTLLTDTEVVAYLLDMLIRKHGLSIELACAILASPFWKHIDNMADEEKKAYTALRVIYGSALLNGPFAVLFANNSGLVGLNDRVKLRPLVVAERGSTVYLGSEASAIKEMDPNVDNIWSPKAGVPVILKLDTEDGTRKKLTSSSRKN